MLKGDLTTTPLAPLLVELADGDATGCLVIVEPAGEEALVYLKAGLVYSVSVPGTRPQLGAKLVSSGALAPEALAEALEAQRTELQGWRLGELLVHLGYVDQPVVEAFVKEQVSEALWDLLRWNDALWKFRKNVKAREDVGPPMAVVELLETLRRRGYEWETISAVVHGPGAVPKLSTRGDTNAETTVDNDAWSMLCKIDGIRSVEDLARDCGYTLFEAGHVIVSLVQAGLVDIDEDVDVAGDVAGDAGYGARTLTSALSGAFDESELAAAPADDEDPLARLARLVNEVAGPPAGVEDTDDRSDEGSGRTEDHIPRHLESIRPHEPVSAGVLAPTQLGENGVPVDPMVVRLHRETPQSFAASLARVSTALSEVLGEAPTVDPHDLTARSLRRKAAAAKDDPDWQRRKKLRSAAAEELVTAQALVETLRPGHNVIPQPEYTGGVPKIVSHETELRRAAEREAVAAQQTVEAAEAEEAQHLAAQAQAAQSAEDAARVAEQERLAAEEAARLAEQAAEAERVAEEERLAAEEAARVAEEERLAAEEAQRQAAEADRLAEEQRRITEDRLAAEEAARVAEEERLAAEEAQRQAAEAAEADRLAEDERRITEDRLAAEEAERQAAEAAEADRLAEEQRRITEDRLAAEEAERQAAEAAEADRLAAQEESLLALEAVALATAPAQFAGFGDDLDDEGPLEIEQYDAQAAAYQQAIGAAAAAELAATGEGDELNALDEAAATTEIDHQRETDRLAAEEATRREDDAAAATALLIELAASSEPDPAPQHLDVDDLDRPGEPDGPDAEPELAADDGGWNDSGMADTAALLRELSSLGTEDEPESQGPSAPRAPRPAHDTKKTKKKIGLFGL